MANRYFQQFIGSFNHALTHLELEFHVGSTGAVSLLKGSGVAAVTRLAAGTYEVKLQDAYYRHLGTLATLKAPVTGSAVDDGSFVSGTTYEITTVGDTDWAGAGLPSGVVAAVGQSFVATGTGGAGSGAAKAVGTTGIESVEVCGDANTTVNQKSYPYLVVQCLGATSSSVTTPVATDPANGSIVRLTLFLRNSSLKGKGE